jgi:hypothetical protein
MGSVVVAWLPDSATFEQLPVRLKRAAQVATAALSAATAVKPVMAPQVVMAMEVVRRAKSPEKERESAQPLRLSWELAVRRFCW